MLRSTYNTELKQLDFFNSPAEAKDHINLWVDKNTHGKIPKIINGEIARSTNMILASAVYFKGFWENSFFEMATVQDNFYPDGERTRPVSVKMMATGGVFPYYESPEYNCRIIGLPYKGNETTMYILQPFQSSRARLQEFQNFITAQKIDELISKMVKKSAVMAFPKMHLVKNINMKSLLNILGVRDIFTSGVSDLSLINKNLSLASNSRRISGFRSEDNYRNMEVPQYYKLRSSVHLDRFNENALKFSRSSEDDKSNRKVNINERVQRDASLSALQQLENERLIPTIDKSDLFVEEIFHKVDIDVNEHGTEAAAATLTYLRRSGTDVQFRAETPFIFLIRHDPTKLILFYGIVNEPEL